MAAPSRGRPPKSRVARCIARKGGYRLFATSNAATKTSVVAVERIAADDPRDVQRFGARDRAGVALAHCRGEGRCDLRTRGEGELGGLLVLLDRIVEGIGFAQRLACLDRRAQGDDRIG